MLRHNKLQISSMMNKFIWDFNVGDNIAYNFKVLFSLYDDKDRNSHKSVYNKPLIVLVVSIIECVMYDFVVRLEQATNQYPASIPAEKRERIKIKLGSQKVKMEIEILDQTMTIQKVKNYSLDQLIKLLQEFELLGPKDHRIYSRFQVAGRLRNRVHIFNWYNNFETKERNTYSDAKLSQVELLLDGLLEFMSTHYSRPGSPEVSNVWVRDMTA